MLYATVLHLPFTSWKIGTGTNCQRSVVLCLEETERRILICFLFSDTRYVQAVFLVHSSWAFSETYRLSALHIYICL